MFHAQLLPAATQPARSPPSRIIEATRMATRKGSDTRRLKPAMAISLKLYHGERVRAGQKRKFHTAEFAPGVAGWEIVSGDAGRRRWAARRRRKIAPRKWNPVAEPATGALALGGENGTSGTPG
jgi:hypothetical protein